MVSRTSSSMRTRPSRNRWKGRYHSRSQWVWGTITMSGVMRLASDGRSGDRFDDLLGCHDVRQAAGESGERGSALGGEGVEGLKLAFEGLGHVAVDRPDLRGPVQGAGGQDGGGVHQVGGGEDQLQRAVLVVDADGLPVGGVAGQVVP